MIDREGLDKPFIVKDYIFYMFFNIISASILGKSYTMDDPELKRFKYVLMDVGHEVGARFMLWDFSSFIRLLDRRSVQKQQQILTEMSLMIRNKFKDHYADYSDAIERDICDALITAKNEALREGKEWAPYLTDDNLAMSAMSLFLGGISTSQNTFQWIVLLMCYYPEVQRKLRQEIETQIGDRMPTHEDRNRCHYVMAFIAETLRFRNIIPIGVPHRALVDIQIGKYAIPENTSVAVYHGIICRNDKDWHKANEFIPERFLDSEGRYITVRSKAYIPFGVGRRMCLGEKLAIADLFLVLVTFLQSTRHYNIVVESGTGIDADPNGSQHMTAPIYKVAFSTII
ncbi:unnamed protein product [Oppiella nova]|uniref:Cytochrome P450 n=1 Tax=Oppiella nova TaxID=334625 RepID=A0A7R9MCI1_9ACAR|nr:unnamed protein product [Oppiella nova]CAG2174686.1 unnamed protein product [Oppiella nova]